MACFYAFQFDGYFFASWDVGSWYNNKTKKKKDSWLSWDDDDDDVMIHTQIWIVILFGEGEQDSNKLKTNFYIILKYFNNNIKKKNKLEKSK